MAFQDKLRQTVKIIGSKAGDTLEAGKLTIEATREKTAAADEIAKIGEFYYRRFLAGGQVDPAVVEYCDAAQAHYEAAAKALAAAEKIKADNGIPTPEAGYTASEAQAADEAPFTATAATAAPEEDEDIIIEENFDDEE